MTTDPPHRMGTVSRAWCLPQWSRRACHSSPGTHAIVRRTRLGMENSLGRGGFRCIWVLASMLALWTWRDELAQAVLPPSLGTAVVLLSWWAALTPWGALVVVRRLPLFATALSEGRAHPVRADRWRRAIWSGSSRRSAHAAMHRRDDPQAIGVVVRDDRRDLVTRCVTTVMLGVGMPPSG